MFNTWLLKLRVVNDRPATGAGAFVPVPASETWWGLPVALSVIVKAPVRAPVAVGVNETLKLQLLFAAREVPQVLVWAKSPVVVTELMFTAAVPVLEKVTI